MDQKIIDHFKQVDPILFQALQQIIKTSGPFTKREKVKAEDYFNELVESIISQQLSVKASDTIYQRVKNLLPKGRVTPANILKLQDQELRDCGLSWNKVKFVKDLAEKIQTKEVDLEKLDQLSDLEIMEQLIKIKGIGPWTVEMFLMFTLSREDIFSAGDLGLKNAIKKLYNLENPTKEEIEIICNKWSPHKTAACRILWKSLEIKV